MADAQESEDQESRLPEKPQAEYTRSMAIERTVKEIRGLTIEEIVGQELPDDEKVFIVFSTVDVVEPDEQTRREAMQRMNETIVTAQKNAEEQGVTAEEADAAVDEAMREVRRRKP